MRKVLLVHISPSGCCNTLVTMLNNGDFGFPYCATSAFSTPAVWCRVFQSRVFSRSLFELAFKTAAMLCENFVRKTFSPNPGLLNWHFRQHLLAEAYLRCDYDFHPRFACSLLPQLNTRTSDRDDYPFTIHLSVTEEHTEQNFEQYLLLRC